jgi:prepilin-type N-terminal cleavage/methylation domain-containing protein
MSRTQQRGFTLMELIAVIAIAAILSVSAAAMFDKRSFDTGRFTQELQASLAYAQKEAVARRRTVTVTVNAGSAAFAVCKSNPCAGSVALPLPTPDGGSSLAAPTGVVLSPLVFNFEPSGMVSGLPSPITVTVTGDITNSVFIEGTGYVHR